MEEDEIGYLEGVRAVEELASSVFSPPPVLPVPRLFCLVFSV